MKLKELIEQLERARHINHQAEEGFINNDNMTVAMVSETDQHTRFPITFVDDDDSFFVCIGADLKEQD
tara:strand:- start:419 stop:622 length:204 start_codon:yes stop_codon:yes gene_type:complete